MNLESCIAESMDKSMNKYLNSPEYIALKEESNAQIDNFKRGLSPEQISLFDSMYDTLIREHAAFTEKAYVTGVINGITLNERIIHQ